MAADRTTYRNFALAAWLLVLAAYGLDLASMQRHVFWSPDEGGKLLQARSIRARRGLSREIVYPGAVLDPELRMYAAKIDARSALFPIPRSDGGVSFHWPIWFPLASKLPLALFGVSGIYLLPLLAGLWTAALSGRLAAEVDPVLEAPAVLLVGLATPIYFYSLCAWEHTLATAFATLSALSFVRGGGRLAGLLWSLPAAAAALLLRLEMLALPVALVAAWGWLRWLRSRGSSAAAGGAVRSRVALAAAVALTVALVVAFALVLPERHQAKLGAVPTRWDTILEYPLVLTEILISSSRSMGPQLPSWSWAALLAGVAAAFAAPLAPRRSLRLGLTAVSLTAVLLAAGEALAQPETYLCMHGLLLIAPFLIICPLALRGVARAPDARRSALVAIALTYAAAAVVVVSANSIDAGGSIKQWLEWGPRYLLAVYPLAAVVALVAARELWATSRDSPGRWLVVPVLLLAIAGFLFEQRGVAQATRRRAMLAEWQQAVTGHGPVLTDIWWLPGSLADFYSQQPVLLMRARKYAYYWRGRARANGVRRFAFISLTQPEPDVFPGFAQAGEIETVGLAYIARYEVLERRGRGAGGES